MSNEQIPPNFQAPEPSAPPTPPINPLMAKLRVPPEIHKIPSGGIFYDPSIMDLSTKGEVHIHPMTALDELEIKSPDLLFSGEALINVINRCVPEIHNPEELFIKDVDFLMLVIRKATFGSTYEVEYDHQCQEIGEDAINHSYNIDLNTIIRLAKDLNPKEFKEQSQVTIGNEESTYNVTLSPMKLKHMVEMLQSVDDNLNEEERKVKLFSTLVMIINNVDGITDPTDILEFLSNVPTTWVEKITIQAEKISKWGPTFTQNVVCKECGSEAEIEININPLSFFTS